MQVRSFPCAILHSWADAVDFDPPMDEQIEHLVKLQAVDLESARLNAAIMKLPAEIAAAESALKAAEKQAAGAKAVLAHEEEARAKLEAEIAAHRQKAARLTVQLDTVKTPAQAAAIEHEVEFSTAEADRLENEEFASLERSETQDATLQAAHAQIEERTANLATIRQSVARRAEEFKDKLVALAAERARLRPLIAEEMLLQFDRLAKARGTALSRAENQQCTSCSMSIRLQVWSHLREGQLLHCDSCGRLLYFDPAFAPAAKEAQPAAVPGAGHSIRNPRSAQ